MADDAEPEIEKLAQRQNALALLVQTGALSKRPLDRKLLCEVHRSLFEGVWGHAGRIREPGFGSEHLTFGPFRSLNRREVPNALNELLRQSALRISEIARAPEDKGYERRAIESAVRLHAEVVRIHPFEDGNGRSSRALMSIVLVRLGLRPIPIAVPKSEYLVAMERFIARGDLDLLMDLSLRLYPTA